jgi:hypothetical protein
LTLRAAVSTALFVAGAAAFACAHGSEGRDLAAGWRALLAIRGAPIGDPVSLDRAPYADARFVGRIENPKLAEASGLAVSRRTDDLLWSLNDSGRKPILYALGTDGRDRGTVQVEDANEVDWEALASFESDGRAFLVVADTGDNLSWRRSVEVVLIEEPSLAGERFPDDATVSIARRIRFRFEDGPRDSEALAIDPATGDALLLSKRTEPPALYRLSLAPDGESEAAVRVAQRLGDVSGIPPPTEADVAERPWLGRYSAMPTGLDLSADGRYAAVVTYKDAYLFPRIGSESWAEAFARRPQRIPMPPLRQAEAIAFGADERTLFVTTEKLPTPLFRFDWRK